MGASRPDDPADRGSQPADSPADPTARRRWLLGAGAGATLAAAGAGAWVLRSCAAGAAGEPLSQVPLPARGGTHEVRVAPAPGAAAGRRVNRRVLGANVQWVDDGDDLLDAQGVFRPEMLALVQAQAPTGLRFPGGMQSDTYHWQRGIGPLAQRGSNEHAHSRVQQPSRMGTLEFLELCEACGARPLLTVNLVTGSAEEAAAWVRAVNVQGLVSRRSGRRLPPVVDWELGNEPYLKPDERPDLVLAPAETARRALAWARAMRRVDPRLRLGLPVVADRRNGVPTTPYPGYTREVLARAGDAADWLAVHNAYMPFAWRPPGPAALYWGAMAGAAAVRDDLQAFGRELARLRPARPALPLAITEYNALFTLGRGDTDALITSPAGALYLADLLRMLAQEPAVEMAHHWSLSGNWMFGALHSEGRARPAHEALRLLGEALHGEARPLQVTVGTVATPPVGLAPAQPALPLLEALYCADGPQRRLLLIHKDPARTAHTRLDRALFAGARDGIRLVTLEADELLATGDTPGLLRRREQALPVPAGDADLAWTLAPGSVALLRWRVA